MSSDFLKLCLRCFSGSGRVLDACGVCMRTRNEAVNKCSGGVMVRAQYREETRERLDP